MHPLLFPATELLLNDEYLILSEQAKITDLRGVVSRNLYFDDPECWEPGAPLTYKFGFERWISKKDKTVRLLFDADNKYDVVSLHILFAPACEFAWISGTGGKGRIPRRNGFKSFVHEIAFDALNNKYDDLHGNTAASPSARGSASGSRSSSRSPRFEERDLNHGLQLIRSVKGFTGGWRQRCSICKRGANSAWCCSCPTCSTAAGIVVIHDTDKHLGIGESPCLEVHRRSLHKIDKPNGHPRRRPGPCQQKKKKGSQRQPFP